MQITINSNNSGEVAEAIRILTEILEGRTEQPKQKTAQKSTNGVKEDSKVKEEVKTPQKATESSITLTILKESCKNAVTRTSRDDVKNTISEFAPKLSDVKEDDYGKLYKKLQQLGK